MFSKKKETPRKTEGGKALMAQMGYLEIDDMVYGDLENDEDLEAELRALQESDSSPAKIKKPGKLVPVNELQNMIDLSMKEVEDDEDVSDTEDPELLAELEGLESDEEPTSKVSSNSASLVPLLESRLIDYKAAAQQASSNDVSKAKRFERGIKTIENLLSQAKSGQNIKEEEIPPKINIKPEVNTQLPANSQVDKQASVQPPAINQVNVQKDANLPFSVNNSTQNMDQPASKNPSLQYEIKTGASSQAPVGLANSSIYKPTPIVKQQITPQTPQLISEPKSSPISLNPQESLLLQRREQYKLAALNMKSNGNNAKALEYMKTVKLLDSLILAVKEGKPIDSSQIPLPILADKPSSTNTAQVVTNVQLENLEKEIPPMTNEEKNKLYKVPESSGNMLQALEQRLAKYKESEEQANQEENSGKAKRMGRIVKQYADAIKLHKSGKPFDAAELPNPPGFAPLPTTGLPSQPASTSSASNAATSPTTPAVPATNEAVKRPIAQKPSLHKQTSMYSRAEQQASFLLTRQSQFKQAALDAKNRGDIELAKKYIRQAKGFDQMIEASRNGLPVDLAQIPTPPGSGEDSGFVFVEKSSGQQVDSNAHVSYQTLQDELLKQIKLCESNRNHFTKLGDVSSASKFDKMGESTRKDLDALKNAFDHADPVPRFHYETRQFSLVKCCTELGDNDLELTILRGVNFNPPAGYTSADLHTYVKYEFPFPDTPQVGETRVEKGTHNPEFNQKFKLEVNRKSRAFLRLLKSSKTFKFDIYYKRGFLKGDKLLGSMNLKLQSLEDKCVLHECADLIENRKAVGGKLEVLVRVRDPFVSKQVEEMSEKWLVIDEFLRRPPDRNQPQNIKSGPTPVAPAKTNFECLGVLKFEKEELDQKILKYEKSLRPQELDNLRNKSKFLAKKIEETNRLIVKDGQKSILAYLDGLKKLKSVYMEEAKASAGSNSVEQTKNSLMKQKIVQKEIESLLTKLNSK